MKVWYIPAVYNAMSPEAEQVSTTSRLGRHYLALQNPRGIERAIAALRDGLVAYGVHYGEHFEDCEVGRDSFLGKAWLDLARAYLALLNGPTGRLDCGSLDGEVRHWARKFGFTDEEADQL